MFDNMQIQVMGAKEEEKSEASFVSDNESGDDIDNHFQEDENHISQKHARHTDIEERDREDMDFPDEVDGFPDLL